MLTKHAHVTGKDRDELSAELSRKYAEGASIRMLAAETGRSYGFIHRVLREAGVELRSRGGSRSRNKD
ncbi:MAG TPA: helix-turn-helix domain-containing protein [Actinopolymorphaceae bacterium]|jgi:hypothetical protein